MKTLNKEDLNWLNNFGIGVVNYQIDPIIHTVYGRDWRNEVEFDSLLKLCEINWLLFRFEIYENIK